MHIASKDHFMLNYNTTVDNHFREFVLSNAYVLIFQGNTLKIINDVYGLSKTEFTVLSAGYLIQKSSCMNQFSAGEVRKFVVGIHRNEVYLIIRRLSDRRYIQQDISQSKRKRYALSQKGIACISSYNDFLYQTFQKFELDNPRYYMVYP